MSTWYELHKKNFHFLNLVKRIKKKNGCGLHIEHQLTWFKLIAYLFFCLPKCHIKQGTFKANYFFSACLFLMKAVADRRGSDRKVKRMIFTWTLFCQKLSWLAHLLSVGYSSFFYLWQFSIKSLALRQCLHLRQMFTWDVLLILR